MEHISRFIKFKMFCLYKCVAQEFILTFSKADDRHAISYILIFSEFLIKGLCSALAYMFRRIYA